MRLKSRPGSITADDENSAAERDFTRSAVHHAPTRVLGEPNFAVLCGYRESAHDFLVDEAQPIVIYRSINRDGETFALAPGSLQRLRDRFGDLVHFRSRVFIGHETRADYEAVHRNIVPQIVQLLTGLTEERLAPLGGVAFRDPATDRDIPLSAA